MAGESVIGAGGADAVLEGREQVHYIDGSSLLAQDYMKALIDSGLPLTAYAGGELEVLASAREIGISADEEMA